MEEITSNTQSRIVIPYTVVDGEIEYSQVLSNIAYFLNTGNLLLLEQEAVYRFLSTCLPKDCNILDIGCGAGIGTNILSHYPSRLVIGMDKDEKSISFGRQCFPRVSFLQHDILKSLPCNAKAWNIKDVHIGKIEYVTCVEVIEHIKAVHKFLTALKKLKAKAYYLTTPNKNTPGMGVKKPNNPLHVQEWTPKAFHSLLKKYFRDVTLLTIGGKSMKFTSKEPIIIAKVH